MAIPADKKRMYTCQQWRELKDKSGVTSGEAFRAIGIPEVVFKRAMQPNNPIDIPFKYEEPLLDLMKKRIAKNEPLLDIDLLTRSGDIPEEDRMSKVSWLKKLKEAISGYGGSIPAE